MPHGPGGAEHGLVLVAEVPGSILAARGIVLFGGPIGRLAEHRPDEVQSLSKRAKLVNVQFREALDDNPQIGTGRRVDEVGRLASPFYCDDDPPVNILVIAAPGTEEG